MKFQKFAPARSAGLFLGARTFRTELNLTEIPFGIDDAIDLAHLFIVDLELIPPANAQILIEDTPPAKPESQQRLEKLRSLDVPIDRPEYIKCLSSIAQASKRADRDGFLIATFASHGFISDTENIVCTDTVDGNLVDTSLSLRRAIRKLDESEASRKILVVDTCRERVERSRTSSSPDYGNFLRPEKPDLCVIYGAHEGGFSFDDRTARNGMFTGAFIDILRGQYLGSAPAITNTQDLLNSVDSEVKVRAKAQFPNRDPQQFGISYYMENMAEAMNTPFLGQWQKSVYRKDCVYVYADNSRQQGLEQEVMNRLIHPVCNILNYQLIDFFKEGADRYDRFICPLHTAQLAIFLLSPGQTDNNELLLALGFRGAAGKPSILITNRKIPKASGIRTIPGTYLFELGENFEDRIPPLQRLIEEAEHEHFNEREDDIAVQPYSETIIDSSPWVSEDARYTYVDCDSRAAAILAETPDAMEIINTNGVEFVRTLQNRNIFNQAMYFDREQEQLRSLIEQFAKEGRGGVPTARIPLIYRDEKSRLRAYLPVITDCVLRRPRVKVRVMYLDVSSLISQYADGHYELAPPKGTDSATLEKRSGDINYYAPLPIVLLSDNIEISNANLAAKRMFENLARTAIPAGLQTLQPELTVETIETVEEKLKAIRDTHTTVPNASFVNASVQTNGNETEWDTMIVPLVNLTTGHTTHFAWYFVGRKTAKQRDYVHNKDGVLDALNRDLIWDKYAFAYDQVLPHVSFYKEMLNRHCEVLSSGQIVADIGAGTGNLAIALLERGEFTGQLRLLDPSRTCYRHFDAKCNEDMRSRVKFCRVGAEGMEQLPDYGRYDALSFMMSLYNCLDADNVLRKAYEALNVGGRLIITDPKQGIEERIEDLITNIEDELHDFKDRESIEEYWECVKECGRSLAEGAGRYPCFEDLPGALEAVGFRIEDGSVVDSHYGVCGCLVAVKPPE